MAATVPGSGDRLNDRYRLERPIGRGGMAVVWLAEDEQLQRPVAIKLLSDVLASDPDYATRFAREARTAAGVSHPNLVDIFDFATVDGRPYLVMEYVQSGTLAEQVAGGRHADPRAVAEDLLRALSKIHGAGIIHRDIKPENVLVGNRGEMRLADFGIARAGDATRLTRTGELVGTIRYLAPELREGREASVQSDLYSLGILLRETFPSMPRDVFELARRLSEPDPASRPGSALEALAGLEEASPIVEIPASAAARKRGEPSAAPAERPPATQRAPEAVLAEVETTPSRHVNLSPWRVAAGIIALAAVIVGIALFATGGDEPDRGGGGLLGPGSEQPVPGGAAGGNGETSQGNERPDDATGSGQEDGPVLDLGGGPAQP